VRILETNFRTNVFPQRRYGTQFEDAITLLLQQYQRSFSRQKSYAIFLFVSFVGDENVNKPTSG